MNSIRWIAWRILTELLRDRRTIAFFLLVPVIIMTLVYFAIVEDDRAKVAVVTRGGARLFEGDLVNALEKSDDIDVVSLDIPDDETDPSRLGFRIEKAIASQTVDGVLFLKETLLAERFEGKPGELELYVEGSRPTVTATVLSGITSAIDELAAALPVVIDASCSGACADSVNNRPMELKKRYLYGDESYRTVDFFLPVLPPFFAFFLGFVLSMIAFQRERIRGTLERMLIAPVSFLQIVLGYLGGFSLLAILQIIIVLGYFIALIQFPLSVSQLFSLTLLILLVGMTALLLGLATSFLSKNEFQAIQFIPLIILPQIFLSDLIWRIDTFPLPFRIISKIMPITHANIAARNLVVRGNPLWDSWPQLAFLVGFIVFVLLLLFVVARSLRRAL